MSCLALLVGSCARTSIPEEAGLDAGALDAPLDSAWCALVTCGELADRCHRGVCDITVMSPPCFDTARGGCSTYACTQPCDVGPRPDAGP